MITNTHLPKTILNRSANSHVLPRSHNNQIITVACRPSLASQRVPTTIECHKHLILINNQQLSPTSNTTRFFTIYDQSGKIIFDLPSSKSTYPMRVSHGKTKIQGKTRVGRRARGASPGGGPPQL